MLAEDIFVEHLQSFGRIYSEESGYIGDGAYKIILDPIDGSDNFLSQIPYYGSSVAYEVDGAIVVGVICNFASGEIFIKTKERFVVGDIMIGQYEDVAINPCASVGIFERAYRSKFAAKKLYDATIKYRIPGAAALSFAYAHYVDFVIFEGALRDFDAKAGLFMCENLYKYEYNDLLLICHDKKRFDELKTILLGDA